VGLLDLVRAVLSGKLFAPPSPQRPIPWQPDALAPVFYGYRDYDVVFAPVLAEMTAPGVAGGRAPVATEMSARGTTEGRAHGAAIGGARPSHPCRVFFPTLDGSPDSAAILAPVGGFPLIVLVHGECREPEHYKKWFLLSAQLARSGYVVVIPELPGIVGGDEAPDVAGDLALLWQFIDWMRTGWEHRETLMPAPFTGVAGHSHGGGLAAALVASNPAEFKAWASLSGVTRESLVALARAPFAKLFMWGTEDALLVDLNPAPESSLWEDMAGPKHSAIFHDMHHWDYLEPGTTSCDGERGACGLTPSLTRETLMMFFGRYLTPDGAPDLRPRIASSLRPPALKDFTGALSSEQQRSAGAFLGGFEAIDSDSGCGVQLTWETSLADRGSIHCGTAPSP
jgi:dienelactone hydrolase